MNVCLSMDTAEYMIVTGIPEVAEGVEGVVHNGTLTLNSTYSFKMFRPAANKPEIRLHLCSVSRIEAAEACGITCEGQVTGGEIGLIVMAKYADIDLDLGCHTVYYWDYSLSGGKIVLTGTTDELKIWNFSLMTFDASGLVSGRVLCENSAQSPCYVRAVDELKYSIKGQGDIYYYGHPASIIDRGRPPQVR